MAFPNSRPGDVFIIIVVFPEDDSWPKIPKDEMFKAAVERSSAEREVGNLLEVYLLNMKTPLQCIAIHVCLS